MRKKTAWQLLVIKTMKEHKGKSFSDILKIAKSKYKK